MPTFVAAGAGFLVAVLWFDLMFDVQTRRHPEGSAPEDVLASISAYYRRVTTEARPMNLLVALVMALTVGTIIAEIVQGVAPWWITWVSLAAAASAMGLARFRTVPNAVRLGRAEDSHETRDRLARRIYRDHLYCFSAMVLVVGLHFLA